MSDTKVQKPNLGVYLALLVLMAYITWNRTHSALNFHVPDVFATSSKDKNSNPVEFYELQADFPKPDWTTNLFTKTLLNYPVSAPIHIKQEFNEVYATLEVVNMDISGSAALVEVSIDDVVVLRSRAPPSNRKTSVATTHFNLSHYTALLTDKSRIDMLLLEGGNVEVSLDIGVRMTSTVNLKRESQQLRSKETVVSFQVPEGNLRDGNPEEVRIQDNENDLNNTLENSTKDNSQAFQQKSIPIQDDGINTDNTNSDLFSTETNPTSIVPLDNEEWIFTTPEISNSNTAAQLNLFISSVGSEADYYKSSVNYFNVYVGNTYVGTVAPKPTLHNEEHISRLSNRIFKPVVAHGEFTGMQYHLNLVPFLPLLWGKSQKVRLTKVMPFRTAGQVHSEGKVSGNDSTVQELSFDKNWLVSASISLWKHDGVESCNGKLQTTHSSREIDSHLDEKLGKSVWKANKWNKQYNVTLDANHTSLIEVHGKYAGVYEISQKQWVELTFMHPIVETRDHGPYSEKKLQKGALRSTNIYATQTFAINTDTRELEMYEQRRMFFRTSIAEKSRKVSGLLAPKYVEVVLSTQVEASGANVYAREHLEGGRLPLSEFLLRENGEEKTIKVVNQKVVKEATKNGYNKAN